MKIKLLFLITFLPFALCAQTELMEKQILEDYTIFKNILTKSHPSIYEYTTKPQWDSIFRSFETDVTQIKNSENLFKSMSAMAVNARDVHLRILHPKMNSVPDMFPLLLKIIDEKLYTDTKDFGIPLGSEIVDIDGFKSQKILKRMFKYAASDGYNVTKKYRQIESEFGILHYYEFGAKIEYTVTYIKPDNQIDTAIIQSQPFQSIGMRTPKRSSYFSAYHHNADKIEHSNNFVQQKLPFVYFIDSIKTAVLTVNSFSTEPQEFKSILIDIFKEIRSKKATSLIIDVRQNNGGYRANAITLFSFISDQPFKQRISESAITSTLIEASYVKNTMSDYTEFFKNYFLNSKEKDDRWVLTTDRAEEIMKPYKQTFNGKTYVLIGGNTFSAGSAFALNIKNSTQIKLFGEETGGGYYFHTGQFPVLYELPNSKIMFNISLVKISHFVKDNAVKMGGGVLPDVEINLTQDDLINGIDAQLDYILKRIVKQ